MVGHSGAANRLILVDGKRVADYRKNVLNLTQDDFAAYVEIDGGAWGARSLQKVEACGRPRGPTGITIPTFRKLYNAIVEAAKERQLTPPESSYFRRGAAAPEGGPAIDVANPSALATITDSNNLRVHAISGVIWFSRDGGEEKERRFGRFGGEVTIGVKVDGHGMAVQLSSIKLDCIDRSGIYASSVSQKTSRAIDDSGTLVQKEVATIDGQFVNEISILPGDSLTLRISSEFAARGCRYPYQWDLGFLRIRGYSRGALCLFDSTFQYEGARSVAYSEPPQVSWFNDSQLEKLLNIGYMDSSEVDVLKSIPPDERMLMLWDKEYAPWCCSAARKVIDDVWSRLHGNRVDALHSMPVFPPPFPTPLGNPRRVVVELQETQRVIILPSSPVRPDCLWIDVNSIHLEDCQIHGSQVTLSVSAPGYLAEVIYLEDAHTREIKATRPKNKARNKRDAR